MTIVAFRATSFISYPVCGIVNRVPSVMRRSHFWKMKLAERCPYTPGLPKKSGLLWSIISIADHVSKVGILKDFIRDLKSSTDFESFIP